MSTYKDNIYEYKEYMQNTCCNRSYYPLDYCRSIFNSKRKCSAKYSTTRPTRPTGYLIINTALVRSAGLDAVLQTNAIIPTDGSGGAFGYGILTAAGIGAVIVSTTHQGVLDSVTQGPGDGPIWHNHFVQLGLGVTGLCDRNQEVVAITLQQPGRVLITGTQALLQGIPSSFTGTDALTGKPITLSPGHNVLNVVSFVLDPKFQGGSLKAVCVEHITPAQHIIKS